MTNNIIIIAGQTAVGKTKKALSLALQFNGELVNCDSRQIYKKLDIITGKDFTEKNFTLVNKMMNFDIGYYSFYTTGSSTTQANSHLSASHKNSIKVWLYDIVDPKYAFSSYDYTICAIAAIQNILMRRKTPIIVGGTGYYLKHLLFDIPHKQVEADWALRKSYETLSVSDLQAKLAHINRNAFDSLNESDKKNPRRLIRRIEICLKDPTFKACDPETIPVLQEKLGVNHLVYNYELMLHSSKVNLEKAIKKRVENRIKDGAFEEVQNLLEQGYTVADFGLKTIGYTELIRYFKGEISKEESIALWITKEIQYAKRQKTFFKKLRCENFSTVIQA